MAADDAVPVSRRRAPSQKEANGSTAAAETEPTGHKRAVSTKKHRKKTSGDLSPLGKLLRLRRLARLSPAVATAVAALLRCKATALVLFLTSVLILGSLIGGAKSFVGVSFSGDHSFSIGSSARRQPSSARINVLGSVAFFTEGAAGYDAAYYSSGGRSRLADRDVRLAPAIDRSSFGRGYGGLKFRRRFPWKRGRVIGPLDPNDETAYDPESAPLSLRERRRRESPYGLFDDDVIQSAVFRWKSPETKKCRRVTWHKFHRPTCNDFHSIDLLDGVVGNGVRYLDYGHYRESFAIKGRIAGEPEMTLKLLRRRSGRDDYPGRIEKTRTDALVMERLTSSPWVTNVYGHCATSITVEYLPGEIWDVVVPTERVIKKEDLNDKFDVDNKNGMSPEEKLELALGMAEALSELHGFKDGSIVHNDIELSQFLRMPSGEIKINDFNTARPLLWDRMEQKYCKYYNGVHGGKKRAPEEYTDPPGILDEKVDIYILGNCFYGILTGLYHFCLDEAEVARKKLLNGKRPYIDERWKRHSFAERKLIEVMERCWIHDSVKRTDIFWVVRTLREAVAENAQLQAARA